jgi:1,4-alpha-glucan branching enzyme
MNAAEAGVLLAAMDRAHPDAVRLAEVVSLAVQIEPALLRRARLTLLPDLDAGAEADLWLSPLMQVQSPTTLVLWPDVAKLLRTRLSADPKQLERAYGVLQAMHLGGPPAMLLEEEITRLALSQDAGAPATIRARLLSVLAAIVEQDRRGLARWVASAVPRLQPELLSAPEVREVVWALALAASVRLNGRYIPVGAMATGLLDVPEEVVRRWLPVIVPNDAPQDTVGVRLLADGRVEVSAPPSAGAHRLEVPSTDPLVLTFSSPDSADKQSRVVALRPGTTQYIPAAQQIPADIAVTDINTAAGTTYRLGPFADLLARKRTQFVLWRPGVTTPSPALYIGIVEGGTSLQDMRELALMPVDGHADLWHILASDCDLREGQVYHYWFRVRTTDPYSGVTRTLYVTDPTAWTVDRRFTPPAPDAPDAVASNYPAGVVLYRRGYLTPCDPGGETVDWDGDAPLETRPANERLVIYELPTRWSRTGSADGIEVGTGTFRDVLALVVPQAPAASFPDVPATINRAHLQELGVNALELLPPADSDQLYNWGYGTANYFAASYYLGLPAGQQAPTASRDLALLIKTCHEQGMRFFCDMVMAFCQHQPYHNANFLEFFVKFNSGDPEQGTRDGFGGDLFRYSFWTESYDPLSGERQTLVPARQYMKAYLAHWMLHYRLDGLRLDSINNIGNYDFVQECKDLARELWRMRGGSYDRFLVVGVELSVPPALIQQDRLDGLWNEHFKQIMRRVILGQNWDQEPSFELSVRKMIDCRLLDFIDGTQAVNYFTSHDVGGFGNERLHDWLRHNGIEDTEPRIKLAFACLLTAVGVPMILAGEEFADHQDLNPDDPQFGTTYKQVDPVHFERLQDDWRTRIFHYVARLVRLRTSADALAVNDTAFIHQDFTQGRRIMAWQRGRDEHIVVVTANFSDYSTPEAASPDAEYRINGWPATPPDKVWREITEDRVVPAEWAGREPIYPWHARVYALEDRPPA